MVARLLGLGLRRDSCRCALSRRQRRRRRCDRPYRQGRRQGSYLARSRRGDRVLLPVDLQGCGDVSDVVSVSGYWRLTCAA